MMNALPRWHLARGPGGRAVVAQPRPGVGPVRRSILLLCAGLGGCVTAPFATTPADTSAMARLTVGDRVNYAFVPGRDGILSIDGRTVPGSPVREIWIVPGRRTIGYACPGWVTVDGPATLSRTFVAGGGYKLTCEDPPAIKQVSAGG